MLRNKLLLIFIIGLISFKTSAQEDGKDTELWTAVELKYKASKKLTFELREMLRLKDDLTSIDQYYTQLEGFYEFIPNVEIGLGYRFVRKNDNVGNIQGYENIGRIQTDLKYTFETGRWTNGIRFRFQNRQNYTKPDETVNAVRFKGGTSYNIRKWKLDPKFTFEYFLPNQKTNRYRLTLGTNYKFSKRSKLYLYYSYEKEVTEVLPDKIQMIRLRYRFTIN